MNNLNEIIKPGDLIIAREDNFIYKNNLKTVIVKKCYFPNQVSTVLEVIRPVGKNEVFVTILLNKKKQLRLY